MPENTTATYKLLDLTTGDAHGYLRRQRQNLGLTHDEIAQLISEEMGIKVSREWVRLRCVSLGIEKGDALRSTA